MKRSVFIMGSLMFIVLFIVSVQSYADGSPVEVFVYKTINETTMLYDQPSLDGSETGNSLAKGTLVLVVDKVSDEKGALWAQNSNNKFIPLNALEPIGNVDGYRTLPNGVYSIKQKTSGLSFDVATYGTTNGTNLQLTDYVANTAQQFRIHNTNEATRIWSVCSPSLVVDIGGNDTSTRRNGINIDLWKSNVDYSKNYWKDQEWSLTKNDDGSFNLFAKHYDQLVIGSSGSNVELVDYNNSNYDQRWVVDIISLSDGTSVQGAEIAIDWARRELEKNSYSSKWKQYNCLAFVFQAYKAAGVASSSFEYATLAANQFMTNPDDLNPPIGALLFYDYTARLDGIRKNWGHISIYIGNGQAIHAYGKGGVVITDAFNFGLKYKGWGVWK